MVSPSVGSIATGTSLSPSHGTSEEASLNVLKVVSGQFIPSYAVDRPAARGELDGALLRPLTLVTASAGAGKSVLLSQWVRAHPERRFAWVDLSDDDNDPHLFVKHLIDTVRRIAPEMGSVPEPDRRRGASGEDPLLLRGLAARLGAVGDTGIVLENLHAVHNRSIVAELSTVAALLPPTVHLVVSSRIDTPEVWNENRLRGEVGEIGQSSFALDLDEAATLLATLAGRRLDAEEVAVLLERTEGWVTGLQLAASELRQRSDTARFVAEFHGADRLVAGYLTREVLDPLSPVARRALQELSVLDRFDVDLVAALGHPQSTWDLVRRLEQGALFATALDDSREWFRLHPLLRELLQHQLRAADAAAETRVLLRAATWHLDRGEPGTAIEYLLRAHAWDRAIDAILACNVDLFEQIDTVAVARQLNEIPDSALSGRIDVQLLRAVLTATTGATALAEDRLRAILATPGITAGETAYAQTFLASLVHWRSRPDVSIEFAERALEGIDSLVAPELPASFLSPAILRTIALMSRGRAYLFVGDFPQAQQSLEEALRSEGAGYSVLRIGALGSLALVHAWCGRTREASDFAAEAQALARERGQEDHPATAEAHLATALVALATGRLDRAETALRAGARLASTDCRASLSWVAFAAFSTLDDLRGSDQIRTPPLGSPPPLVAEALLARRARAMRLNGSPEGARRLLSAAPVLTTAVMFEKVAAELTLGQLPEAQALLREFTTVPDARGPLGRVRGLLLASWCAAEGAMGGRARALLQEALQLAEADVLVTVFVHAGPSTLRRVVEMTEGHPAPIAEAVRAVAPYGSEGQRADGPPVHLTERERELLALLPTRFTNVELAERFYVSVNTIKTHTAHIYGKLGVSTRSEAIARATQLGLLSTRSTPALSLVDRDY